MARLSTTAKGWMPERCFCSDFDAHGKLGAGQRAEVLQALLREGAISLGDLESLEAPSFCSGLITGGAWTAGVVVGLVLVSLIIQGFGFLWGRCRDRAPGDAEIPGAKPGRKLELRVFATFGGSLGVCENKMVFHRPLASCSQGVEVTKTKGTATTSKLHEQICDFSGKTAPQAKNKEIL